jgi:RNA polymerase-binding transcription factor
MNGTWESALPVGIPVREYMCEDQLAFFRGMLEREREVLLNAAQTTASELKEIEATPDPSDRASLEEDHALELRIRGRELGQLHAIEQALLRIRDGSYGWCAESGDPIGLARLVARPTATLSVAAQQRHESQDRFRRVSRPR